MLGYLHEKVRKTPWLGRAVLASIPNIKWHVDVDVIGRMEIRLREHRTYWLRNPLFCERFMLGGLKRFLSPGDVVFDIGANIGLYSRFLAQYFQASQVFSFEPMSNNIAILSENLALGNCASQVTVVPSAIGNDDGMVSFQIDSITSNSGTLDEVTHGIASQSHAQYGLPPVIVQVPIARIDTLILERGFPVPAVLKLDVEGAEALVITGAHQVLKQFGPRMVIETHGPKATRDTLESLWSVGYHCFAYLSANGTRVYRELVPADLSLITENGSIRCLAASPTTDGLEEPIADFYL
jgi:FkbM family methyltransferase